MRARQHAAMCLRISLPYLISQHKPKKGAIQRSISDVYFMDGDETVPLSSATLGLLPSEGYLRLYGVYNGFTNIQGFKFMAFSRIEHQKLAEDDAVLKEIAKIINNNPTQNAEGIKQKDYSVDNEEITINTEEKIKLKISAEAELYIYNSEHDELLAYAKNDEPSETHFDIGTIIALDKNSNGLPMLIAYLNQGSYKIVIKGTNEENISYEIQQFDVDNKQTDVVRFEGIAVEAGSVVETFTDSDNGDAELDVDFDGDGTVEETLEPTLVKDEAVMTDNTSPSVNIILDTSIENEGTITITGDDTGSGLYRLTYGYQINGSNIGGGDIYTEPVTFSENGYYEISGYAQDKNENFAQSELATMKISNPDINRDGIVDLLDISAIAKDYGLNINDEAYSNIPDVTCDGATNLYDLARTAYALD